MLGGQLAVEHIDLRLNAALVLEVIGILCLNLAEIVCHSLRRLSITRQLCAGDGLLQVGDGALVLVGQAGQIVFVVGLAGNALAVRHAAVHAVGRQLLIHVPLAHHLVDVGPPGVFLIVLAGILNLAVVLVGGGLHLRLNGFLHRRLIVVSAHPLQVFAIAHESGVIRPTGTVVVIIAALPYGPLIFCPCVRRAQSTSCGSGVFAPHTVCRHAVIILHLLDLACRQTAIVVVGAAALCIIPPAAIGHIIRVAAVASLVAAVQAVSGSGVPSPRRRCGFTAPDTVSLGAVPALHILDLL